MKTPPGGWPLATQVGIAVLVTIALSVWQVGRGFEKLAHKEDYETRLNLEAVPEASWSTTDVDYRKVELRGQFDAQRYFFIEERRHRGRPGYWVLQVFDTERDRYLVNRGWVSVESSIRVNPTIDTPDSTLSIIGIAWPNPVKRSSASMPQPDFPIRLRDVDIGQMARLTSARALEIRLIAESPGVLQAAPLQVEFSAAIHWGYAAQWLLIGGLVIGGYWFLTIRKDKESQER